MTLRWPEMVLRPRQVSFDIAARTLAGAASISGGIQAVSSSAGLWKATFAAVVVNTRDHVLCWRALAAILDGRAVPIEVPRCRAFQPIPADSSSLYGTSIPHSDDTYFDDETGYENRVIDVQLSAAIVAGATSAAISITYAGTLEAGQDFSLGERMYRLKSVVFAGSAAAAITFSPPSREAVAIGTHLNFDSPVCRMRLATDGEMDLLLDGHRWADPTVNFIEDI